MKIRPRDVLELFKESGKKFFRNDCPRLAAALSYYTVFALAPLIALLLLLAGIIWKRQPRVDLREHVARDGAFAALAASARRTSHACSRPIAQ